MRHVKASQGFVHADSEASSSALEGPRCCSQHWYLRKVCVAFPWLLACKESSAKVYYTFQLNRESDGKRGPKHTAARAEEAHTPKSKVRRVRLRVASACSRVVVLEMTSGLKIRRRGQKDLRKKPTNVQHARTRCGSRRLRCRRNSTCLLDSLGGIPTQTNQLIAKQSAPPERRLAGFGCTRNNEGQRESWGATRGFKRFAKRASTVAL